MAAVLIDGLYLVGRVAAWEAAPAQTAQGDADAAALDELSDSALELLAPPPPPTLTLAEAAVWKQQQVEILRQRKKALELRKQPGVGVSLTKLRPLVEAALASAGSMMGQSPQHHTANQLQGNNNNSNNNNNNASSVARVCVAFLPPTLDASSPFGQRVEAVSSLLRSAGVQVVRIDASDPVQFAPAVQCAIATKAVHLAWRQPQSISAFAFVGASPALSSTVALLRDEGKDTFAVLIADSTHPELPAPAPEIRPLLSAGIAPRAPQGVVVLRDSDVFDPTTTNPSANPSANVANSMPGMPGMVAANGSAPVSGRMTPLTTITPTLTGNAATMPATVGGIGGGGQMGQTQMVAQDLDGTLASISALMGDTTPTPTGTPMPNQLGVGGPSSGSGSGSMGLQQTGTPPPPPPPGAAGAAWSETTKAPPLTSGPNPFDDIKLDNEPAPPAALPLPPATNTMATMSTTPQNVNVGSDMARDVSPAPVHIDANALFGDAPTAAAPVAVSGDVNPVQASSQETQPQPRPHAHVEQQQHQQPTSPENRQGQLPDQGGGGGLGVGAAGGNNQSGRQLQATPSYDKSLVPPVQTPLPSDCAMHFDTTYRRHYYVLADPATGKMETTWTHPLGKEAQASVEKQVLAWYDAQKVRKMGTNMSGQRVAQQQQGQPQGAQQQLQAQQAQQQQQRPQQQGAPVGVPQQQQMQQQQQLQQQQQQQQRFQQPQQLPQQQQQHPQLQQQQLQAPQQHQHQQQHHQQQQVQAAPQQQQQPQRPVVEEDVLARPRLAPAMPAPTLRSVVPSGPARGTVYEQPPAQLEPPAFFQERREKERQAEEARLAEQRRIEAQQREEQERQQQHAKALQQQQQQLAALGAAPSLQVQPPVSPTPSATPVQPPQPPQPQAPPPQAPGVPQPQANFVPQPPPPQPHPQPPQPLQPPQPPPPGAAAAAAAHEQLQRQHPQAPPQPPAPQAPQTPQTPLPLPPGAIAPNHVPVAPQPMAGPGGVALPPGAIPPTQSHQPPPPPQPQQAQLQQAQPQPHVQPQAQPQPERPRVRPVAPSAPQAPGPLPAGWEAKVDPRSGKTFYLNHATKSTQWDFPQ